MANFPLKTATIQKQKETKLRSRARRSQNISKFEGAGIDFKKKKRKENKISPPRFIPRRGVGKKETRFYRLFSEGNGEMEPPLEDQRALTDVEHALHECRRFLSLLRPTGPRNMAIRRGGNTRLSRKTRKHDTRPGQGPRTRITRVSCDE